MQPVKPGYQTSEFWLHLAVQLGIAVLAYMTAHSAALPPAVAAVVVAVGPLAMAWLQSQYSDDRTSLKSAALQAGQSAGAAAAAEPAKAL